MISKVRRKITQELALVTTELTREESTLPVDLWKKSVCHLFIFTIFVISYLKYKQ